MMLEASEIRGRLLAEGGPDLPAGEKSARRLARFAAEVAHWGSRTHLVGRTRSDENIMANLLDSIHLLRFAERFLGEAREERMAADIGSGAGFPGIVWAILNRSLRLSLYERREKARIFLERTAAILELGDRVSVKGEARRAEGGGAFDIVTSKAAGRLGAIAPVAAGLLLAEGLYVTVKGDAWKDELREMGSGPLELEEAAPLPAGRGTMLALRKGSDR